LESSKFKYNVKTYRIAQELIKNGFKVIRTKYENKKEQDEKNLLEITMIKQEEIQRQENKDAGQEYKNS